ncbi:MAG: hydroxymethylbilane synthase [Thermoleophilaceae bacterium]
MKLRLGTRGSALALAQAGLVRDLLSASRGDLEIELVPITTAGDQATPAPEGDKSRFVKEIEDALLAERIDLAVHSAKDVPAELPDGLAIVGVPARADARDVLCTADGSRTGSDDDPLAALAPGARVGTSSLRRQSQLLAARRDLEPAPLRGNVDTRLRKLDDGEYEALVLAAAGLERLGLDRGVPLPPGVFTPAPGQGCLALEARAADEPAAELARSATDDDSLVCLSAERALVAGIGASCHTPVGAHARLAGGRLELAAYAGMPDGSTWLRDSVSGGPGDPIALGEEGAARLLAAGAGDLLHAAEAQS